MSESQSRYGIMEELNKRKIAEKEKLAALERELDETVYTTEKDANTARTKIAERESNYQQEHNDWKRTKELESRMLTSNFERRKLALETEIEDREENYQGDFTTWKVEKEQTIAKGLAEFERYKKDMASKIKEKEEVIKEIEAGVASLKEMSSEQKAKE